MKTLALALLLSVPLAAQEPAADFATWWKQFQTAVANRDTGSISKGAKFPLQWENGPTRNIQVASHIAARFDFYFTTDLKNVIATSTPEQQGSEAYTITWKARGNEYSLYFKNRGTGWSLDGLSEGPP